MTVRYDHQRQTGALKWRVAGDHLLIGLDRLQLRVIVVGYQTPTSIGGPCGSLMLKCWNPTVASA